MDKFLYKACEEIVADHNNPRKEDVNKLFNYIDEKYIKKNKSWNYGLLNKVYDKIIK